MFVLSLWPSLLPKLSVTQGIVSGMACGQQDGTSEPS